MNKEEYDKALYLAHHGIKGQKWGIRRFQNEDGSLTPAGEKRAQKDADNGNKWATSQRQPSSVKSSLLAGAYAARPTKLGGKMLDKSNDKDNVRWKAAHEKYMSKSIEDRHKAIEKGKERTKTAFKIGAAVAGTALAAYGTYKLSGLVKNKARNNIIEIGNRVADVGIRKSHDAYAEAASPFGNRRAINMAKAADLQSKSSAIRSHMGAKGAQTGNSAIKSTISLIKNRKLMRDLRKGDSEGYLDSVWDEVTSPKKQSVVSLAKDALNSKSDTKALGAKTKEILDRSKETRAKAEKTLRSAEKFLNDDKDYNARIMEALRKMEEMGRTGKKSK